MSYELKGYASGDNEYSLSMHTPARITPSCPYAVDFSRYEAGRDAYSRFVKYLRAPSANSGNYQNY